jgi:hypothetical protein
MASHDCHVRADRASLGAVPGSARSATEVTLRTITNTAPRAALLAVGILLLAGCSAGGAAGGPTGGDTPVSPDTPVSAPDCAPLIDELDEIGGVEGAYSEVDPTAIVGVRELPADVIAAGCYVSSAPEISAFAVIPDPDGSAYASLATFLEGHYTLDDEANGETPNAHSWYGDSSADFVGAFDGVTAENIADLGLGITFDSLPDSSERFLVVLAPTT